jgi:rubrerythrin
MTFNPLVEKGIPLDQQLRNWSELNVQPYIKDQVDPYTRTRVITMNGIETEGVFFSHQFARHTADPDLRRNLAMLRRIEQQQQKVVNWLTPGNESTLEVTIGYEQVAVDLTAFLARHEPDPYLKQAFEFGLLEDFDHLYRYANLLEMTEGKKAEEVTGRLTEIMPGRPTVAEHRHPYDDVRRPSDRTKADPVSLLHVLTLVASEQQTMNFYMNVGNRPMNPLARGLYLEIAQIEEQHVTHYESLLDPNASWLEQEVLHQYNECYLYYSFMQQESDRRIKQIWELHLNMEIEHLRIACDLLRQYENRDPEEFLPQSLPETMCFEENKQYIRQVLADQVNLTTQDTEFVPVEQLPEDAHYFQYQKTVNAGGVPSEQVIEEHQRQIGRDYRMTTEGEHPLAGANR